MSQASQHGVEQQLSGLHMGRRLREGAFLILLALAAYLLLALTSYSPQDPGWSYVGPREQIQNAAGPVGAWLADVCLYLFGFLAYLFPVMVAWSGWLVFKERRQDDGVNYHLLALRWLGFAITLAAGSALAAMHVASFDVPLPTGSGGVLGRFLGTELVGIFNFAGATLLLLALFLSGFTLFTGISWLTVMDQVGGLTLALPGVIH